MNLFYSKLFLREERYYETLFQKAKDNLCLQSERIQLILMNYKNSLMKASRMDVKDLW